MRERWTDHFSPLGETDALRLVAHEFCMVSLLLYSYPNLACNQIALHATRLVVVTGEMLYIEVKYFRDCLVLTEKS